MAKITSKKPKGGKIIKPPELPISTDNQVPTFCLEHIQPDYCLTKCEKDEKVAFADTLYRLSRATWSQLIQRNRHGGGFEKISQTAIKAAIPPIVTPDTNLIAFRFDGLKAMVGFRERSLFRVIWLDRTFKLYDH